MINLNRINGIEIYDLLIADLDILANPGTFQDIFETSSKILKDT